MSTILEVRTVGVGRVSDAEKQAVKWLAARRIRDGAWDALIGVERAFVRRLTNKPYDLLIWTSKTPPGEAWALSRDSKQGRSLVQECLGEFTAMGLVRAGGKISYEKFCAVVGKEQSAMTKQSVSTKPATASVSGIGEFSGSAYFEANALAWRATVSRAVRTQNVLVIQLHGQVDGGHYRAEANLTLRDGRYLGTAAMTGIEQKWTASAQISLTETFGDDSRWELAGDWVEKYDRSEGQAAYDLELELERSAAKA